MTKDEEEGSKLTGKRLEIIKKLKQATIRHDRMLNPELDALIKKMEQDNERLETAIREALKTFDSGVWMPIPSDTIKTILKKALEEEDGEL